VLFVVLVVAAVAASGCSGSSSTSTLAKQYLTIANAGNRSLDHDFDRLESSDPRDLPAARADLHDAAATERRFDRAVLKLSLPPAMAKTAAALVRVNETRAALTTRAATAGSVVELHTYQQELAAANTPVEDQVKTLRTQLGLPPPSTS
jgi:hypothetical protein